MHSFVLLALATSALALPVDVVKVANVDVNHVNAADGIVDYNKIAVRNYDDSTYGGGYYGNSNDDGDSLITTVAKVGAEVIAPIGAAIGNVQVKDVNALNDVGSGNKVTARGAISLPIIVTTAHADVDTIVGQIKDLLSSYATASAIGDALKNLNATLAYVIKELETLNGLQVDVILEQDNVEVSVYQAASDVAALCQAVADLLEEVKTEVNYDLSEVYYSLGCTIHDLLKEVTYLVPTIASTLHNLLYSVVQALSYVGITLDLSTAGM